ncbi:hypothetical protein C8R45DRAFT_1217507 [Mycena sanguinolenta]|nr:hypothetical protein C8R45DRAFT_1217507 [Mycena sanguinolenta]
MSNPMQSELHSSSAARSVSLDGKIISVPTLTVEEFCAKYGLDAKIKKLLQDAEFQSAGALLEVSEEDLKHAEFKLGQIAELKRALRDWLNVKQ